MLILDQRKVIVICAEIVLMLAEYVLSIMDVLMTRWIPKVLRLCIFSVR